MRPLLIVLALPFHCGSAFAQSNRDVGTFFAVPVKLEQLDKNKKVVKAASELYYTKDFGLWLRGTVDQGRICSQMRLHVEVAPLLEPFKNVATHSGDFGPRCMEAPCPTTLPEVHFNLSSVASGRSYKWQARTESLNWWAIYYKDEGVWKCERTPSAKHSTWVQYPSSYHNIAFSYGSAWSPTAERISTENITEGSCLGACDEDTLWTFDDIYYEVQSTSGSNPTIRILGYQRTLGHINGIKDGGLIYKARSSRSCTQEVAIARPDPTGSGNIIREVISAEKVTNVPKISRLRLPGDLRGYVHENFDGTNNASFSLEVSCKGDDNKPFTWGADAFLFTFDRLEAERLLDQ